MSNKKPNFRSLSRLAWAGLCSLAWLAGQPAQAAPIDVDSATPYLGIGVTEASYFDGSYAFTDLMRGANFRGYDWTHDVGADANGLPTRDFVLIFNSGRLAAGTYKLGFKGRASLAVDGQAESGSGSGAFIQNQRYDAATNTTTADVVLPVNVQGNTWLLFRDTRRTAASTTADGVTDVHLFRPGYPTDGSVTFTREYVQAMRKFHVIRGMDFVMANYNPSVAWSERTTMAHQGYVVSNGQPWELLVQMANATQRDLWINVPVRANDAYVRNLARLLRYGSDGMNPYTRKQANPVHPPLRPGLRVYVEYGNEIWNCGAGFYGCTWAMDLARPQMGNPAHPIAYDGAFDDPWLAQRRWIAYRSAGISLIFRQVFGDAAMMDTVRPVLATQAGNGNAYLSEALKWAEGFYGQVRATPANPVARKVQELWWGAGGAAYYDSSAAPVNTSEATKKAYFAGLPNAEFGRNIGIESVWARGYGLRSVAYEGGPSPGGTSLGGSFGGPELWNAYNNDPRMKARMRVAHDTYTANGGQLLNYFIYSGPGPWSFVDGLQPDLASDTDSVKLRAIDAIRTQPKAAPTLGTPVPGSVFLPAAGQAGIQLNGGDTWRYGGQALRLLADTTAAGKAFAGSALIPIRAPRAGTYHLSLTAFPETNAQVELLVNGEPAGTVSVSGICATGICNGSEAVATPTTTVSATLPEGLSVVRIRPLSNWVWVKDLVVQ